MNTDELCTLASVLSEINREATALRIDVLVLMGNYSGNGDNHPAARFHARQDASERAEELMVQIARAVPLLAKSRAPYTTRDLIGR